ncbi:hypothetical protein ACJX0J_022990 [Zea mays]
MCIASHIQYGQINYFFFSMNTESSHLKWKNDFYTIIDAKNAYEIVTDLESSIQYAYKKHVAIFTPQTHTNITNVRVIAFQIIVILKNDIGNVTFFSLLGIDLYTSIAKQLKSRKKYRTLHLTASFVIPLLWEELFTRATDLKNQNLLF